MSSPLPSRLRFPAALPTTLNTLYHASRASAAPPSHLIFFIPGNPGLISYYDSFLSHLAGHIPSASILGVDHAGFSEWGVGKTGRRRVYMLKEQVDLKLEVLRRFWGHEWERWNSGTRAAAAAGEDSGYVTSTSSSGAATPLGGIEGELRSRTTAAAAASQSAFNPKIVLIGHSMGAWLLLETLVSHIRHPASSDTPGGSLPTPHLAILLTPTVVELANSAQGKAVGPILTSPWGYHVAQTVVWGVATAARWVPGLTSLAAWMSGNAREHVEATLKPWVLHQVVGLAAEELVVIRDDRWGFEGGENEKEKKTGVDKVKEDVEVVLKGFGKEGETKMVWYFAERDGWVGNGVVERVESWGVGKVVRDRTGIVHAFSLRHAKEVAEVVKGIVEEEVGL